MPQRWALFFCKFPPRCRSRLMRAKLHSPIGDPGLRSPLQSKHLGRSIMRTKLVSLVLAVSIAAPAQTTMAAAAKPSAPAVESTRGASTIELPVRRVVLYKNGVGFFEHAGRVRGSQDLSIKFTTSQL